MTVTSEFTPDQYSGTGAQVAFTYTFKIFDEEDIKVITTDSSGVETVEVLTTDYSVSGVGDDAGGTVTYVTAPGATDTVTLTRNEPFTQQVDYVEGDDFPAAAHEEALDRSVMRDQVLNAKVNRALLLAESTTTPTPVLPAPVADQLLGWDSSGVNIVNISQGGASIAAGDVTFAKLDPAMIITEAEGIGSNDNDTTIPTSAAVKDYADSIVAAGVADADYGDITVSSSGSVWSIDAGVVDTTELATDAVTTVKITDANVTTAKIADDAVTLAKIAAGTDGELITWDASGDPATVAVGTSGQVLTSNGAGAAPTFQAAGSGQVVLIESQSVSSSVTSVEFTTGVTSDYNHFILQITDAGFDSSSSNIIIQSSTDTGSTWDSPSVNNAFTYTSGTSIAASTAAGKVMGTRNIDRHNSAVVDIMNLTQNAYTRYMVRSHGDDGGTEYYYTGGYARATVETCDAVRISMSSGNITDGEFILYGVKNT